MCARGDGEELVDGGDRVGEAAANERREGWRRGDRHPAKAAGLDDRAVADVAGRVLDAIAGIVQRFVHP